MASCLLGAFIGVGLIIGWRRVLSGVTLPIWLYEKCDLDPDAADRRIRWGSRRPLRVCLMLMDREKYGIPPIWMGCIWRFNFMVGPEQAVEEGLGPVGPCHVFYRRRGRRVLGVAWEGDK